jgi:hypothetical protein
MKLSQTEFFRQFVALVAGLLLAVGTVAFISIPASLERAPAAQAAATPAPQGWHLT